MKVEDKYISEKENSITPDKKRTIISNEAYAICEFLDLLIKGIERARTSLK